MLPALFCPCYSTSVTVMAAANTFGAVPATGMLIAAPETFTSAMQYRQAEMRLRSR